MRLTALDVHQKEFGHGMKGYREDEVDAFLDAVAAELDRRDREIAALEKRCVDAESSSVNLEAERNTINNALLTAQRASDEVLARSKDEARKVIEEAERKATEIVRDALAQKNNIGDELKRLKEQEGEYRARVLQLIAQTKDALGIAEEVPAPVQPAVEVPADAAAATEAAVEPAVESAPASANAPEPLFGEAPRLDDVDDQDAAPVESEPEPESDPDPAPAPAPEPESVTPAPPAADPDRTTVIPRQSGTTSSFGIGQIEIDNDRTGIDTFAPVPADDTGGLDRYGEFDDDLDIEEID
ncbi:MAG: DivIVA domain-containing protein [Actinomycetes bacterium]|jgi:cell division initiation protein|nr:DivIVA domain-containing protein [Actinomycetes bacterium]